MRKQEEPLVEEQRPPPAHVPNNGKDALFNSTLAHSKVGFISI